MNCPVHQNPFVERSGQYGTFFACPTKLPNGTWCKEKPPKETGGTYTPPRTSTGQTEASGASNWSNGVPPVFATKDDHYLEQIKGIREALERIATMLESHIGR